MWDITPIEIALNVEPPRFPDASGGVYSPSSDSRICLVAGFALSSHLNRIVTAIDRVIPQRLPKALSLAPVQARAGATAVGVPAVAPMLPLLHLQHRLTRAIKPGLATTDMAEHPNEMSERAAHFVRHFITSKAIPTFEPALPVAQFESTALKPVGITLYRLDPQGAPQSILGRWAYVQSARGSNHLISGP